MKQDDTAQIFLAAVARWLDDRKDPRLVIRRGRTTITELAACCADFCAWKASQIDTWPAEGLDRNGVHIDDYRNRRRRSTNDAARDR